MEWALQYGRYDRICRLSIQVKRLLLHVLIYKYLYWGFSAIPMDFRSVIKSLQLVLPKDVSGSTFLNEKNTNGYSSTLEMSCTQIFIG